MFKLEYAVFSGRRFIGWIDSGHLFEQHWDAVQLAFANGLEHDGQDFLVTECIVPPTFGAISAKVLERLK